STRAGAEASLAAGGRGIARQRRDPLSVLAEPAAAQLVGTARRGLCLRPRVQAATGRGPLAAAPLLWHDPRTRAAAGGRGAHDLRAHKDRPPRLVSRPWPRREDVSGAARRVGIGSRRPATRWHHPWLHP